MPRDGKILSLTRPGRCHACVPADCAEYNQMVSATREFVSFQDDLHMSHDVLLIDGWHCNPFYHGELPEVEATPPLPAVTVSLVYCVRFDAISRRSADTADLNTTAIVNATVLIEDGPSVTTTLWSAPIIMDDIDCTMFSGTGTFYVHVTVFVCMCVWVRGHVGDFTFACA